jgi:hypothetical protein
MHVHMATGVDTTPQMAEMKNPERVNLLTLAKGFLGLSENRNHRDWANKVIGRTADRDACLPALSIHSRQAKRQAHRARNRLSGDP